MNEIKSNQQIEAENAVQNFRNKEMIANPEKKEIVWRSKDFKGFIHFHSWEGSSCGREKISDIVRAIKSKTGLEYIGFNEHIGWPGEEYWTDKITTEFDNIDKIQQENPGLLILKGIEANILKDGSIDAEQVLLDRSDIVVASHHYKNIEPQSESTAEVTRDRWIKAMDNYPEVNVLGHPLRDLPESEWSKVDWDAICQKAKEKNVAIEVGISDSAIDKLPADFLETLARNNNLVVIAPDAHHLVNPDTNLSKPHLKKKDNWLGHRVKDLTAEQRAVLSKYYELKGRISGKTFNSGDTLKGRKPDEPILSEEQQKELVVQLNLEREELSKIESSDALKEVYDILLASEKVTLPNGQQKEKFPLSVATLMRFGRRMDRVRRAGIKAENLLNLWDKDKLQSWVKERKQLIEVRKKVS